ncbi:hypothetical protein [Streptomyces sp. CC77]|uniref:hypothetical protein n=1 Tax=Streptomyces sp. CC77 TaxID=1906739 RepID=UPI001113B92C|nr:hypothetical protein [Streptomyces sp. CC77]
MFRTASQRSTALRRVAARSSVPVADAGPADEGPGPARDAVRAGAGTLRAAGGALRRKAVRGSGRRTLRGTGSGAGRGGSSGRTAGAPVAAG